MSTHESRASLSTFTTTLHWMQKPNDPEMLQLYLRPIQKQPLSLTVMVRPLDSDRIIINFPSAGEDCDGPGGRYKRLADLMYQQKLGAVVRSNNPGSELFLPSTYLSRLIDYTIRRARLISGTTNPDLLLIGYSSGASAVAALAASYQKVSRILLIAPSGDMPQTSVQKSLSQFTGEVYTIIGEDDEVVGARACYIYHDLATAASRKQLVIVSDCGHSFQGEQNERVLQQAPFHAFNRSELVRWGY